MIASRMCRDVKYGEMKLSKSDQVKTFASVVHTCSVGNGTIALDPNSLFHRLIVMAYVAVWPRPQPVALSTRSRPSLFFCQTRSCIALQIL